LEVRTQKAQKAQIDELQARIYDLENALKLNNNNIAGTFRLSAQLGRLLGLMLSVPHVTVDMMQQQLEITSNARMAVKRLRRHLDAYCEVEGVDPIVIHTTRSTGYWLDKPTKERIKKLITPEVTDEALNQAPVEIEAPVVAPDEIDEDFLSEAIGGQ